MADAPLIAFYGDDFTGSTDALEVLAAAGLRAVLFVDAPSPAVLARFEGLEAVGIAGNSRALTPVEMESVVPPALAALARTGARILHYKVCSTFDSSPTIGSFGKVMDLARGQGTGVGTIPIVVGAPKLGRYALFGTLFARHNVDGSVHRIDRHPTMSVHPTTPMGEADMRRHIGAQTRQDIALLSAPEIDAADDGIAALDALLARRPDALVIDLVSEAAEPKVGALLEHMAARRGPLFVVGSSGVEYALAASWRKAGRLPANPSRMTGGPVDRILAVSGSCSPATGAQIQASLRAGFADVALDPLALILEGPHGEHAGWASRTAVEFLEAGRSVVCHTSTGPGDPREARVNGHFAEHGRTAEAGRLEGGRALASAAGVLLDGILRRVPLERFVIAGGDTATAAVKVLRLDALEMVAPLAPGAPLCRALAPGRDLHGRQLVLKGGQIGGPDFFTQARAGRA